MRYHRVVAHVVLGFFRQSREKQAHTVLQGIAFRNKNFYS